MSRASTMISESCWRGRSGRSRMGCREPVGFDDFLGTRASCPRRGRDALAPGGPREGVQTRWPNQYTEHPNDQLPGVDRQRQVLSRAPYQRDYSWSEEQREDRWNDIVELRPEPDAVHYMGALMVEGSNDREFLIIDGRQRLATLSLFALAMWHLPTFPSLGPRWRGRLEAQVVRRCSSDEVQ